MHLKPGAEPFAHDGGPVGVLLCHGFTGSPASLRPWAQHLAEAGFTVRLPRLPGHGTDWREMGLTRWPDWYGRVERELLDLDRRCSEVFVMGLSMGGTLTLRLAIEHPEAVSGIVLVNPSIYSDRKVLRLLPAMKHVVSTVPGISNDIKLAGRDEVAYDRIPLKALHSLTELWRDVEPRLGEVTCPVLAFGSDEDHVVEPMNCLDVVDRVGSTDVTFVPLHDSYHVAPLDHDASLIFDTSEQFVQRLTATAQAATS